MFIHGLNERYQEKIYFGEIFFCLFYYDIIKALIKISPKCKVSVYKVNAYVSSKLLHTIENQTKIVHLVNAVHSLLKF